MKKKTWEQFISHENGEPFSVIGESINSKELLMENGDPIFINGAPFCSKRFADNL